METLPQRLASLERAFNDVKSKLDLYEKYERPLPASSEPFYQKLVRSQKTFARPLTPQPLNGIYPAYVVDTRDPWKIGRVRLYIPQFHRWVTMREDDFPWASPCVFGSLDEQGQAGVPPEGSTVWAMFEMGNRDKPVWVGGYWNVTRERTRKSDGSVGNEAGATEAPLIFAQEQRRWGSRRFKDHNEEANPDQKQLFPPWNNESYNGPDLKVLNSGQTNPTTYPHIFGSKSPEKHMLQMVDGDWEQNKKGKRLVLQSSRGHVLFMKDDCLNHADVLYDNKFWDDNHDKYPHCKWRVKPFNNHDINLKMTGVWLQSVAGARLQMCDEYERVSGENEWDSGWQPKGRLFSKMRLESITEHRIDLRDREDTIMERGTQNGIFLHTATGQCIQLCDDTVGERAGPNRRIRLYSTSNHVIEMKDTGCKAVSGVRSGPGGRTDWSEGSHSATATHGHILAQTGWGQYLLMADYNSQQDDDNQFIRMSNRNLENDPNFYFMFCTAMDKLFFVRGAGTYMLDVQHNYFRHNWEGNEFITIDEGSQFTNILLGMDFRFSKRLMYHWSETHISLAVGKLIKLGRTTELENPLFPVVLDHPKGRFLCPLTNWMHRDYPTPFVDASGERVN